MLCLVTTLLLAVHQKILFEFLFSARQGIVLQILPKFSVIILIVLVAQTWPSKLEQKYYHIRRLNYLRNRWVILINICIQGGRSFSCEKFLLLHHMCVCISFLRYIYFLCSSMREIMYALMRDTWYASIG